MPADLTVPLPDYLRPVLDFVNTVDVEEGTDLLRDGAPALTAWLQGQGFELDGSAATAPEHRLALGLREGLRALALANNGHAADPGDVARLREVLHRLPLVVEPPADPSLADSLADQSAADDLRPRLVGSGSAARRALSDLVAAYTEAGLRGDWPRLRLCPGDGCGWVFWDSSRNGRRRWCTMRVCGNRAKARAYAARSRGGADPA